MITMQQIKQQFNAFSHTDKIALIDFVTTGVIRPRSDAIRKWYADLPKNEAKAHFTALLQVQPCWVKRDSYGNSRAVVSWLAVAYPHETISDVEKRLKPFFEKYRGKDFGGGFVAPAADVYDFVDRIIRTV